MPDPKDKPTPKFNKGDRLAITSGRDAGVRGEIFWIGPNKYGPGMRYGLRTADGATHWVDEAELGPENEAPPEPERPKVEALEKGTQVKVVRGRDAGAEGEIFWVGESRYGPGMRYGIRAPDGGTVWAASGEVEVTAAPSGSSGGDGRRGGGDRGDEFSDAPRGGRDEFSDAPRGESRGRSGQRAPARHEADAAFDDGPPAGADRFDAMPPLDDDGYGGGPEDGGGYGGYDEEPPF